MLRQHSTRFQTVFILGFCFLLWSLNLLFAQAQATETVEPPTTDIPSPAVTDTPTDVPSIQATSTFIPTDTVPPSATLVPILPTATSNFLATNEVASTQESTEQSTSLPPATTTSAPSALPPTEPSLTPIYTTNFDTGDLSAWQLGAGWSLVSSESGQALQDSNGNAHAQLLLAALPNFVIEARLDLTAGTARLNLNETTAGAYHITLDTDGLLQLWRNNQVLVSSQVGDSPYVGWHILKVSAFSGVFQIAVDNVTVIVTQDSAPLPSGTISFDALFPDQGDSTQNALLIDDVSVWTPTTIPATPTAISLATLPPPPTQVPTEIILATLPPPLTDTPTNTLIAPAETETVPETPTITPTQTTVVTPLPTEPPLTMLFEDNFGTAPLPIWTFGTGWSVVAVNGGQALQVVNSDEPTTLIYDNLLDVAAQASFQITAGAAQLTLRDSGSGSYRVTLDTSGQVNLYRGTVIATANVSPSTPGQWRTLRLSVIGGELRVDVDGVDVIAVEDAAPLPPGKMEFGGVGIEANSLLVDDVGLWLPASSAPVATENATEDLTTLIPPTPIAYPPPVLRPHLLAAAQAQSFNNPQTYLGAEFAIIAPEDVSQLSNSAVLNAGCSLSKPYEIYLLAGTYTLTQTIPFVCNTSIYGRGQESLSFSKQIDQSLPQ